MATKKCPIEKLIREHQATIGVVYVRGECAGSKAGLVSIQPRKPIARINEEGKA